MFPYVFNINFQQYNITFLTFSIVEGYKNIYFICTYDLIEGKRRIIRKQFMVSSR